MKNILCRVIKASSLHDSTYMFSENIELVDDVDVIADSRQQSRENNLTLQEELEMQLNRIIRLH